MRFGTAGVGEREAAWERLADEATEVRIEV